MVQRRRQISFIAVVVASLAIVMASSLTVGVKPAAATTCLGGYCWWNGYSGLCLNVQGANNSNGARLIQYTCANVANEDWTWGSCNGSGQCEIYEYAYGRCADDTGFSVSNGTQQQIWSCTGGSNQKWGAFWWDGYYDYQLENAYSGKCLEDYNWSRSNGGIIDQWSCLSPYSSHWNQVWVT
jgi:beta-glucosidase